jgi:D-proline reductase (dithiol) PrdB
VCHQTVSLVARYLEANGMPTVVIATARDIVESAAVPRLLFVDFPLGAPCGEPGNAAQQREVLEMAFRLLETATAPRTTVDAGLRWSKGQRWKDLIFTPEQPFLPGEAGEAWLKKKEAYRKMKAEGKI